jgi:hypothetical protein
MKDFHVKTAIETPKMSSRRIVFKPQWPIPSNGEALRKTWLSHYRTIEKKLFKFRREWNSFETEAQNEYQSWYHQKFANELCIVKLLEDECREIQMILSAVEAQIEVNQMTKRNAFLFVMTAIQEKRDPFPTEEERILDREEKRRIFQEQFKAAIGNRLKEELDADLLDQARNIVSDLARQKFQTPPRSAHEAQLRNKALTEALKDVYEDLRYDQARSEGANEGQSQNHRNYSRMSESSSKPKINASDDIKTLYRKIVRALHPDRGRDMSLTEKDLWQQTMAAYAEEDLEKLRTILLRLEGTGDLKVSDFESIGAIMELARALQEEFEAANQHKNRVKKDPLYRFWASRLKPKNRKILEEDLNKSLRQQIFQLRGALKELNSEMGQFQRRSSR